MKIEGLLTPQQARRVVELELPRSRQWLAVLTEGALLSRIYDGPEIVAWSPSGEYWFDGISDFCDGDLLGLCPLPWEPLPAACGVEDAEVYVFTKDGCDNRGAMESEGHFFLGDDGYHYAPEEIVGWLPIVRTVRS